MSSPPAENRFRFAPLAIWIGVQLGTLALAVFDARLWAQHPVPESGLALYEMLVAQVLFGGLLFMTLLSTGRSLAAAMSIAAMFICAGAVVANSRTDQAFAAFVVVSVWLSGLSIATKFVGRSKGLATWAELAVRVWIVGGAVVAFLIADRPPDLAVTYRPWMGGPILIAIESLPLVGHRWMISLALVLAISVATTFSHRSRIFGT